MSRSFGEYGKQRHAALGNSPNVLERRMLSSCFTLLFILGPFVENSCCFLSTIYLPAVSTFPLHLSFRVGSSRAPVALVATVHSCNCILLPRCRHRPFSLILIYTRSGFVVCFLSAISFPDRASSLVSCLGMDRQCKQCKQETLHIGTLTRLG
jgi:hypothetical protein